MSKFKIPLLRSLFGGENYDPTRFEKKINEKWDESISASNNAPRNISATGIHQNRDLLMEMDRLNKWLDEYERGLTDLNDYL